LRKSGRSLTRNGCWLKNPRTDERLNILGGKLLHHSKDRDEVYRKAVALRPKRSAVVYTGEILEETAVVL
jgi:hypothetical protein